MASKKRNKAKNRKSKPMSKRNMLECVNMFRTSIIQSYLSRVQSTVVTTESKVGKTLYEKGFKELMEGELKDIIHSGKEPLDIVMDLYTKSSEFFNNKELLESLQDDRYAIYKTKTAPGFGVNVDMRTSVPRGFLLPAVVTTKRTVTLEYIIENYRIEASYVVSLGLNDEDSEELLVNKWDTNEDGVSLKDYKACEFTLSPISPVYVNIVQDDSLLTTKNYSFKQGSVVKDTVADNRIIITYTRNDK